ncbi:MAG: ATP-binding protein [Bacteroidota bacterium]
MKRRYEYLMGALWALVICISFFWNIRVNQINTHNIVLSRGQVFFRQTVATRNWNSSLGGVYGPIREFNQPNPYLVDSLRDVVTTEGMHLTKINPAYMTRQIAEMNNYPPNLIVHITSLKPIRPANKPDAWETNALGRFKQKTDEYLDFIKTDSIPIYRYMAPLITEKSCLQCHAFQGYREGDIRGGISITFPAKIFVDSQKHQLMILLWAHLFILLLGLLGIYFYHRMSRKYLAQLHQKNEDLHQLNAKKDKFFSIVAHDLKNPFNSIIGMSDLLVDHSAELEEKEKVEFLVSIQKTSKTAYQLLENLLAWAMSELKKLPFKPEETDSSSVASAAIQVVLASATNKNITINNLIPEGTMIKADKNMLETILRNLVSNAIKYSNPGSSVEITRAEQTGMHLLSVIDHGVGMSPEQQNSLFLFSTNQSTYGTNNEKGTGLGLILCKEFVEKHGGKIWVESEKGKGTTFYFTINL